MNVRLSPKLEALVREKVASGDYRDEEDVIASALALLQQRDKARLDALLAAIDEGDADLQAGRVIDIDSPEDLKALLAGL